MSIVIPIYNAEDRICRIVEGVRLAFAATPFNYELILVDDASTDKSWELIKLFQSKSPAVVKGVLMNKNLGQYQATVQGINASSGRYIITMDDDLRPGPEEIIHLIERKDEKSLIYGTLIYNENNLFRKLGSQIIHIAICIATKNWSLKVGSSFRLFNRVLWNKMTISNINPERLDIELIKMVGDSIYFYPIILDHSPPKSSYRIFQLFLTALKIIFSFSVKKSIQDNQEVSAVKEVV